MVGNLGGDWSLKGYLKIGGVDPGGQSAIAQRFEFENIWVR